MSGPRRLIARDVRHGYGGGPDRWQMADLILEPGQTVACTGPSGSGKTTLLELLAGLQTPRSGTAGMQLVQMKRPGRRQQHRLRLQHLGLVFQSFELLAALTAQENIELPLHLLQRKPDPDRLQRLLERCQISQLAQRKPGQLSHGEKQRVAVCRALIHRPEFLLADEPTANLDGPTAQLIWDLLLETANAENVGLLCVTHEPAILPRFDHHWSMQDFECPAPAPIP